MNYLSKIVALLLMAFIATSAYALEKTPFTQPAFEKLQAAGEVVLIDVYASWCSTCAKQQKALKQYRSANPDKKFHILEVDFDKDKDLVRQFRAPRQSTLLLYKGKDQFWFSVAETRFEVIAAEIDKAFAFKPKESKEY
ncbi:MAG: thiol reductase thioredoxin [Methylophaga sp.]|nr:MAG: thiol reductase thioredoxin [Methylophaga sp.]